MLLHPHERAAKRRAEENPEGDLERAVTAKRLDVVKLENVAVPRNFGGIGGDIAIASKWPESKRQQELAELAAHNMAVHHQVIAWSEETPAPALVMGMEED